MKIFENKKFVIGLNAFVGGVNLTTFFITGSFLSLFLVGLSITAIVLTIDWK